MSTDFSPDAQRDYLLALARIQIFAWLGPKLDASDIVQDVLLKAHENKQQFHGSSEPELRAWLRAILSRTLSNAVRFHRQDKRDARKERPFELNVEESSCRLDGWLAADQSTPSQQLQQQESLASLADALAQLPEEQRLVILWKHTQSLSVADIAERMQTTLPTVAGLLRRGLQRLRELLAETNSRS